MSAPRTVENISFLKDLKLRSQPLFHCARRTQSFRKGQELELPSRWTGVAHQRQPGKQLAKV